MNEDELKEIWKYSPDEDAVRLEKSRLILEVQSDIDHWSGMLKSRNKVIIAIVMIGWLLIFGMMAFTTPYLLSKAGILLTALSFIFWFVQLKRVKKLKPRSFSETYLDYLYGIRKYLKAEIKLQNKVVYWFYLPGSIVTLLWHIGSFKTFHDSMTNIFVTIGLMIVVYLSYKKVSGKFFPRRLKKVEELINMLEE